MKRLITLLALLWAVPVFGAQYFRPDCSVLTGIANEDECVQTTTTGGRIAGRTYLWNGSAWIEKAAIVQVNLQTGTTYTVVNADSRKLVTLSNGSAVAVTLPQAGASSSFLSGWFADFQNRGAGTVTITPTTSTIDGAASLALAQNQGVRIFSDGTNYYTMRGIGGAAGSIGADAVGATEFDEADNYSVTGRWNFAGPFKPPSGIFTALPGSPQTGDEFTVTDCADTDCTTGGGSSLPPLKLRYNGATWDVVGSAAASGTPTIGATFTASSDGHIPGANEGKPVLIYDDDANEAVAVFVDSLGVPRVAPVCGGVVGDCDDYKPAGSGKKIGDKDSSGTVVREFHDGVGTTRIFAGTQATGQYGRFNGTIWVAEDLTSGFSIPIGNASGIADADDWPGVIRIPFDQTVDEVCARVVEGTGTVVIQLQRDDGSAANMLTSNLTAAVTEACTTTFVSGENVLSEGHYINAVIVTGGTPTKVTISGKTTRN